MKQAARVALWRTCLDNPVREASYNLSESRWEASMTCLGRNQSSLFILFGWSSILIASLMIGSIYLSLVERILVL
jgi:hypothetical protein